MHGFKKSRTVTLPGKNPACQRARTGAINSPIGAPLRHVSFHLPRRQFLDQRRKLWCLNPHRNMGKWRHGDTEKAAGHQLKAFCCSDIL